MVGELRGSRLLRGVNVQNIERGFQNALPWSLKECTSVKVKKATRSTLTKERRAFARGLRVAPGTMLCALRLFLGTSDG